MIKLYRRNKWNEVETIPNIEAIVDSEMYELLSMYRWGAHYVSDNIYPRTFISGKQVKMSWMIVGTPLTGYVVDHFDRNGLNTKRTNLRIVTKRQNVSNTNRICTSQYPGVSFTKKSRTWKAAIIVKGKSIFLGGFEKEFDAFCSYRAAVITHGEELLPEYEELYQLLGGK
jgi:hypothetical protein